jgi:hypothetical protein
MRAQPQPRAHLRPRPHPGLLGGRLLLVFLESSRCGSWLDIESLGSICCVCDMLDKSALIRSDGCGGRVVGIGSRLGRGR